MATGPVVITTLDEFSPKALRHLDNVVDINRAEFLPSDHADLARISESAKTAAELFSWDALVAKVSEIESESQKHARRP